MNKKTKKLFEKLIIAWNKQNIYLENWGYNPEQNVWINGELKPVIKEIKEYLKEE